MATIYRKNDLQKGKGVFAGSGSDTPSSPSVGDIWYRTDTGAVFSYDGSNWIPYGLNGQLNTPIAYQPFMADAFGRLRVSDPETIFDSKQVYDNQPLLWDDQEESGSGTGSSHSTATASTTISVGAATAGVRGRQTFMRFNYQPGKSQLAFITFVLDKSGGGSGISRKVGLFDANTGLWFGDSGGTYLVGIRDGGSDTTTTQAFWNIDQMTGSGPSGVTLDFSKNQILVIDFEWLGVGKIRWGFVVDGAIHYVHSESAANLTAGVYMSTPNLPVRYEIENTGAGAASSLETICSTVISEGGRQDLGVLRYKSTGGTHVDANTENLVYAIVGLRLKSGYIGTTINIINIALQLHTASDYCEWVLLLNPTVAGTFTYADETNSAVQTATGASTNTVTGGTSITGGYIESAGNAGGGAGSADSGIENALRLGSAIDGTVDEIVLCVRPIGGSTSVDVEGSITWREIL